jgi:alcohol dehydrogenase
MQLFSFEFQVSVHFGAGKLALIGGLAGKLGKKAMVVTGRSAMKKTGILDKTLELLKESGIDTFVYSEIDPNPTATSVDKGGALAVREGCDFIIALGGGSVIDAAKFISIAAVNPGPVWTYVRKGVEQVEPEANLPLMVVVTTSGSGSEVNHSAVITDPETKLKPGTPSRYLYPRETIIDPELMLTLPPAVTASTGIDVFFHGFENYIGSRANPMSDLLVREVLKLVGEYLPRAYRDGSDLEARSRMAWASALAGMAVTIAGIVSLHALEHPLSGHLNVSHGVGLAALACEYIRKSFRGNPERFTETFNLLSGNNKTGFELDTAAGCADYFRKFLSLLGLDITLTDLKIPKSAIPQYAKEAFLTLGPAMDTNPVFLDEAQVIEIYENSY